MSLSLKQQISLLVVTALVGGGIWSLERWNVERDFKPLYSGMNNEDAGAVVTRLRELGVEYRLNDAGTTVLVPQERLAETRLQLATSGLPQHGRIGFELFDQTKFGATEFAEQVNYRRALEGELERSVLSLRQVEQARVHISLAKESVFLDYQQPAKASVIVKLRRRERLEPEQVRGMAYLVSSAVEGLSPDMVAVIDTDGNLLSRPPRTNKESSDEEIEFEQKVEQDIGRKILHTLEPYLGANKARASVSADVELNAGEQTAEVVGANPVVVSSQKSEEQSQPAWAAGPPGTASNVPRGAGRPAAGGTTLTRKQETSTYQASKTVTRMKLEKGAIKRLSVAVIVDHKTVVDAAGKRTRAPRTPEEMKTIRDLVTASAGIIDKRGDLLTIENLPFEAPAPVELGPNAPAAPPAAPGWEKIFSKEGLTKYRYVLIGIAIGFLALLAAVVALVWLRKRPKKSAVEATGPAQLPGHEVEKQLADREMAQRQADEAALLELKMPHVTSNKAMVLKKILADGAKKDPGAAAQLLRTWMHEDDH